MDGSSLIIGGKAKYEDAIAGQEVNVTVGIHTVLFCYNLDSKNKGTQLATESENGKEILRD